MRSTQESSVSLRGACPVRKNRIQLAVAASLALCASSVLSQGIVTGGLAFPVKTDVTVWGNLLVAEGGTGHNDGVVSLVAFYGHRNPLLSGLPSGWTPEGSPSGPTAVAYGISTVYVLIGEGDIKGPGAPGHQVCNPNGITSPIYSSLLSATFTPGPDAIREGFTLTANQIQAIADGHTLELANETGEEVVLRLVADFRNFIPDPDLGLRQANPFALAVDGYLTEADAAELGFAGFPLADLEFYAQFDPASALGRRFLERTTAYVVDAGMNTISTVSAATGRTEVLTRFPRIANPAFPGLGGPFTDPVPTGIRIDGDSLLVTLLGGFPFPTGLSRVVRVDRASGAVTEIVGGLDMSTDLVEAEGALYILNLSTNFLGGAPGRIMRFDLGTHETTVFAAPVIGATGISYRADARELIVTESFTGLMKRFALP